MSSTADSLTTTPSTAEAWVAYLRKTLVSLAPIIAAGVVVISDRVNGGGALDGVTWVSVAVALAQAVGTYLPDNAIAKTVAGLVLAVASVVAAAVTDGVVTGAEALVIVVSFLAWITASVTPNGAHPNVVRAELASKPLGTR